MSDSNGQRKIAQRSPRLCLSLIHISGPFIDYMHRVQMLAQEGTFVADVLYYYGDHVPNVYPFKHSDMPGALFGFDYDVTDENILMNLGVEDGDIVVPGGRSCLLYTSHLISDTKLPY